MSNVYLDIEVEIKYLKFGVNFFSSSLTKMIFPQNLEKLNHGQVDYVSSSLKSHRLAINSLCVNQD
jgi:hypothetical protein